MQLRLDPNTEQFLDRLTATTRRINRAQSQISSGKRLTAVSEDPDQVSSLLQSRLELETTRQIRQDLSRFKTEVDTAEQAISSAGTLMDRARTIAAQASSTTTPAESRQVMATQLGALLEQMVAIANTSVEGRYVFSGDTDATPAYQLDLAGSPPYGTYLGTKSTRQAMSSDGSRFAVARGAQQLFESSKASENVFAALDTLRSALSAGDQAATDSAAATVLTAGEYLRAQHAWYGSVQSRVNEAIDNSSKRAVRYETQIGTIEDADMTAAVIEFQEATFNRNAALQAHSQIPRKSLFDFMG